MGTDPGPNLDPNPRLTVGFPKNFKNFTLKNDSDPGEKPAEDEGTRRIRQASQFLTRFRLGSGFMDGTGSS
jgi:hypothetical protein